jgi:hypothetical protein
LRHTGVEEGVVVELPIVVDAAPPPRESCKGRITWVKVGASGLVLHALIYAIHVVTQLDVD